MGIEERLLERVETFSRIAPALSGADGAFTLQTARMWSSPEELLLPIGEAR